MLWKFIDGPVNLKHESATIQTLRNLFAKFIGAEWKRQSGDIKHGNKVKVCGWHMMHCTLRDIETANKRQKVDAASMGVANAQVQTQLDDSPFLHEEYIFGDDPEEFGEPVVHLKELNSDEPFGSIAEEHFHRRKRPKSPVDSVELYDRGWTADRLSKIEKTVRQLDSDITELQNNEYVQAIQALASRPPRT